MTVRRIGDGVINVRDFGDVGRGHAPGPVGAMFEVDVQDACRPVRN